MSGTVGAGLDALLAQARALATQAQQNSNEAQAFVAAGEASLSAQPPSAELPAAVVQEQKPEPFSPAREEPVPTAMPQEVVDLFHSMSAGQATQQAAMPVAASAPPAETAPGSVPAPSPEAVFAYAVHGAGGDDQLVGGNAGSELYGYEGADLLVGGAGIDLVRAGKGDDTILGNAGDDRLYGDLGSDLIDGGAGYDTAVFAGGASEYRLSRVGDMVFVSRVDGSETDRLRDVERIEFGDGTAIDTATITEPMPSSTPPPAAAEQAPSVESVADVTVTVGPPVVAAPLPDPSVSVSPAVEGTTAPELTAPVAPEVQSNPITAAPVVVETASVANPETVLLPGPSTDYVVEIKDGGYLVSGPGKPDTPLPNVDRIEFSDGLSVNLPDPVSSPLDAALTVALLREFLLSLSALQEQVGMLSTGMSLMVLASNIISRDESELSQRLQEILRMRQSYGAVLEIRPSHNPATPPVGGDEPVTVYERVSSTAKVD